MKLTTEKRTVLALVLATLCTGVLVATRMLLVESRGYGFLAWNLFLAWIPLVAALLAQRLTRAHWALWGAALVGWLAFFPNAPYIVTDLMHLRTTRGAPLWLDVLVVGSAAATGLLLGLASLRLVHASLARRSGKAWVGWVVSLAVCFLAALGVYLGRFQRWNTWDLLTKPDELLADAWSALAEPRLLAFGFLFGLALVVAYLVYRLLAPEVVLDGDPAADADLATVSAPDARSAPPR
ncbi:MAG: DUF1361 domain-containing protein [Myxococcota bacterium]